MYRAGEGSTRSPVNAEMSAEFKTPSAPIYNKYQINWGFLSSLCTCLGVSTFIYKEGEAEGERRGVFLSLTAFEASKLNIVT